MMPLNYLQRQSTITRFSRAAVLVMLLAIGTPSTQAADEQATRDKHMLELQTEKVVTFKDGYSLILKRGVAVTDAKGEIYTNEVPDAAVLGSFWATPKEGRLISFTAGWVETTRSEEKQVPCTEIIEVLKANLGKKCTLQLPDKSSLSGEILRVLAEETKETPADSLLRSPALLPSLRSSVRVEPDGATRTITAVSGDKFVLRTDDGDVLVKTGDVQRLTVADMKTTLAHTLTTHQRTRRLTFRFDEAGKQRELLIMYFRPGVRWIPTYRIHLTRNKKEEKVAQIAMQAEIINEAEDFLDVPIDIVVGVPNFRFSSSVSPLILEANLRNALQQAAPQLGNFDNNRLSNAMMSQQVAIIPRNEAPVAGAGAIDLPGELTATGSQDLFIYNLPKLKLKKGERVAVPILTAEVPYRDVYTWDLHVRRDDIATAPGGGGVQSPLVLSENRVWRQIELTNNTNVPWTTGAALIMDGQQPLAQELLTYTSARDYCRIPVTIAVDLRGVFTEKETGRELKALTWDNHGYARIKQQALLRLRNSKSETIDAEVSFRFGGKVDQASHDGDVAVSSYQADDWQRYRGDTAVNNSSTVRWKVTIEPGKTFEPSVDYHYFTRQ
ncbi:hypothetical protein [Lignipirellula cremea]|uniref:DUF4139 domain-containing protein n=1 Tax=Lignipirellula cremea TaxID=2528010 RepID=A0A518E4D7_9BACT|nr:hypothetical protein [Lignipirellula cremea]QDU98959.1 hypothetical protein Pla8534_68700 [Lignipirellula cremea]